MRRVIIAGLPRCGTTLLATFLARQRDCTFVTDYLNAFHTASRRLEVAWDEPLDSSARRVVLLMVRDEMLRMRHPVLVTSDAFDTIDSLHRAVMHELGKPNDRVIGHKVVLSAEGIARMLNQTDALCVVLYRDPRDAALSYWHRVGGEVEQYLTDWKAMVRFLLGSSHPRLVPVRYEHLVADPAGALGSLERATGLRLDFSIGELHFRRARQVTQWPGNSAFEQPAAPFDSAAVGRHASHLRSPVVRYANLICRREIALLAYPEHSELRPGAREVARILGRWSAHRAEVAVRSLSDRAVEALRWISAPIDHRN